jgi:hypothetical protein
MVERAGFCQLLCLVMLESTKDQILEVDTAGQHVSSRVRYEMTCLLIRDAMGRVPCIDVWEVT